MKYGVSKMQLKKIYNQVTNQVNAKKRAERDATLYRNLIRHEAKIGGKLFGPVPKNRRREFFCLDKHTWIWHEEWTDTNNERHIVTTRYDVRPNAVLKSQNNSHYQPVSMNELNNLYQATQQYRTRVQQAIYNAV
jgi:hypothetical protein